MSTSNNLYNPLPPSITGTNHARAAREVESNIDPVDFPTIFPFLFPFHTPLQKDQHSTSINARLEKKNITLINEIGKRSTWRREKIENARREREKKRMSKEVGRSERSLKKKGKCKAKGDVSKEDEMKKSKKGKIHISYDDILPLHHLWLGYMSELLDLPILIPTIVAPESSPNLHVHAVSTTSHTFPVLPKSQPSHTNITSTSDPLTHKLTNSGIQNMQAKLLKADFHGCMIKVKRSKNETLIGVEGIVVKETQGTFEVISKKEGGTRKILPKFNSIFEITFPLANVEGKDKEKMDGMEVDEKVEERRELKFEINGTQFGYDPVERVGKKWKGASGEKGWEH